MYVILKAECWRRVNECKGRLESKMCRAWTNLFFFKKIAEWTKRNSRENVIEEETSFSDLFSKDKGNRRIKEKTRDLCPLNCLEDISSKKEWSVEILERNVRCLELSRQSTKEHLSQISERIWRSRFNRWKKF